MSNSNYTQDTTTDYNGGSRIISADEAALIYAGTLPGEQTVASLTPTLLTLAAGLEIIGGQIQVGPEQITLSVGPPPAAATITLEPGTLTLKAGEATITLSAIEGITLTFPGATVQLGLGGKIAISALMMNTTATNFELTATALTETVSGSAERTAASAMFT